MCLYPVYALLQSSSHWTWTSLAERQQPFKIHCTTINLQQHNFILYLFMYLCFILALTCTGKPIGNQISFSVQLCQYKIQQNNKDINIEINTHKHIKQNAKAK